MTTKIKLPANAKLCPHHDVYCVARNRLRMGIAARCECSTAHSTWRASDGEYGLCMMAPSHITNCIRMLIHGLREMRLNESMFFGWDEFPQPMYFDSYYIGTEDALQMFLDERNRRIKLGKWSTNAT